MLSSDFDVPPDLERAEGETAPPLVAIEYRNRGIPYRFLVPLQVLLVGFAIGYVRRQQPLPARPRTHVVAGREVGAGARHESAFAVAVPTGGAGAPSGHPPVPSGSRVEAPFPEVETPAPSTALPASAFALSAPEGAAPDGDAREAGRVAAHLETPAPAPPPNPATSVPALDGEGPPLPEPENAPAGTLPDSPVESPSKPPALPQKAPRAEPPQAEPPQATVSEASPPPAPSAEEIEREILREAERREAERDLMLQAKEEAARKKRLETARQASERRVAFHRELGAILRAGGATAGKQIEALCDQYGREVTAGQETAVRHRLLALPRPTTQDRVRVFRACGIPEPVILDELAHELGRKLLNARGGIRTADEARVRAAEQLVSFPPPPANRPRSPDAR